MTRRFDGEPYDKAARHVVSATVPEAIADASENAKALRVEGSQVVVANIAGSGCEQLPATWRISGQRPI